MPRYIDADALIKRWSDEHGGAYFLPSEIVRSIEEQPTADIVERKHGEWIPENRRPRSIMFYCSECHRTAYDMQGAKGTPKRCRYAWCPNCGADMREETEDAEKAD